jgi:transposase
VLHACFEARDGAPPAARFAPTMALRRTGLRRCRLRQRPRRLRDRHYVEIVRKPADQVGFAVHPRRSVVERFFAWIGRNRRLAKDFETPIAPAQAFLYAASVMLLMRRLARSV